VDKILYADGSTERFFFDTGDPSAAGCRTTMTYTGRNLLATRTEAPGTAEAATESFSYLLDGRLDTRTDARGNDWKTLWHTCCARRQASIDPLGHGTISNTDYAGRVTHTAVVEDVLSHTNYADPIDAKTLAETTTRYDARGRVAARTVWLVPLGAVDPNNVPIAGLDGVSASDGLTTQMVYDGDLTDGVGLDSSTGAAMDQLGGGTYNVSIAAVLSKLAEAPSARGAGHYVRHRCDGLGRGDDQRTGGNPRGHLRRARPRRLHRDHPAARRRRSRFAGHVEQRLARPAGKRI